MQWITDAPNRRVLTRAGYTIFEFAWFSQEHIQPAHNVGLNRLTVETAAASTLNFFQQNPAVALLNVPIATIGDLQRLYGFVVEPAYRNDCALIVHASQDLEDLSPDNFVESHYGYAWTLQRLNHLALRYRTRSLDASIPPMTPIEFMLHKAMISLGLQPRAQYGIGPYRVDFAFPERLLAVEADGRGWHDAERDQIRDQRLAAQGWQTVRFSGSRIWRESSACAEEISKLYRRLPEVPEYSVLEQTDVKISIWQRLLDFCRGLFGVQRADCTLPIEKEKEIATPRNDDNYERLDSDQRSAVKAHEGVVQVIAPAGSGKSRVLVDRVRELVSRGVPKARILCTTFNSATQVDLSERLAQIGLSGIDVRTYHSVGRFILSEQGLLRGDIRKLTYAQLRRISTNALQMQQLVPDRLRGRVMGMYAMTWSLAPLGMTQAGFIAQYFGASVAVAAGAVVILGVAVLVCLNSTELHSLRGRIPEAQRQSYQLAAAGDAD